MSAFILNVPIFKVLNVIHLSKQLEIVGKEMKIGT
jgi:hypothetical protein